LRKENLRRNSILLVGEWREWTRIKTMKKIRVNSRHSMANKTQSRRAYPGYS